MSGIRNKKLWVKIRMFSAYKMRTASLVSYNVLYAACRFWAGGVSQACCVRGKGAGIIYKKSGVAKGHAN